MDCWDFMVTIKGINKMVAKKKVAKKKVAKKKVAKKKVAKKEEVPEENRSCTPSTKPDPQTAIITYKDFVNAVFTGLDPAASEGQQKKRDETICSYISQLINSYNVSKQYNVLILHDTTQMYKSDADNIYNAVTGFKERKPILLVLYSSGGSIDSGYLIGKLCGEYSRGQFVVVVPRQAKSAATLICCAANQIHMGGLSELGPIDPQIDGLPTLGLKNSVEHIADLVKQNPAASEMFAKYLSLSLKPIYLGYYERVAESAAQYAERLLAPHAETLKSTPKQIAHDLVYAYKDHAFVIDKTEAKGIFGKKVICTGTEEYELGNSIYKVMSDISRWANYMKHSYYFIGAIDAKPAFVKQK